VGADNLPGIATLHKYERGAAAQYHWRSATLGIVTDIRRMRGRPDEVRKLVRIVAEADGRETKIMLPRDPAQAGQDQAQSQLLAGYRVETVRMSGSKKVRADAVASQVNIGRVGMLLASWNAAFIDELGAFPPGASTTIK
jgi:predicted phage terminase large subunit-like protein